MRPSFVFALAVCAAGCAPGAATVAEQPRPQASQRDSQQRRGPKPYAEVITTRAVTDSGGLMVHNVDDKWFLEVPDSLLGRDFLLVSRIAGVPVNFPGFTSAGQAVEDRLVRWERHGDRLLLRSLSTDEMAEDSLPIALSVAANNVGPILGAFTIQARGSDSAASVLDVTDFFAGDTPGISGLSAGQRRQYQVRRFDTDRSHISSIKSFPLNVEVRHTQTFEAGDPPFDSRSGTITLEMRQSLIALPKQPMRPRYADHRVGVFSIDRINYGLDEQKAATEEFLRRWRLEPKDPAAYARGELVEPVKPIVYYIDPATPAKWRPYVREGVEMWQTVFEAAGFRNAIVAMDPPSRDEDPDWDPEDIRYSAVRWAASTVRNAVGPSTSDPRTGEIIESDITWYHNHMRSYRNRLVIETGAANPAIAGLDIPDEHLGDALRAVIAHEVGHAIGLPHNMIASSSIPVDSLRSPSFTSQYGVSLTIMDYARQNYVAQPGDGLQPPDFIRRVGPFDDFAINWAYRVIPNAATPEDELPTLRRWIIEQSGPFPYRYLPQFMGGIDPRSQTEDLGDDPIRASTYALANLRQVVPRLIEWTTKPGESYGDLDEIYGELIGQWNRYIGHVITLIGGVHIDLKTADQDGAVFAVVPRARQRAALRFLNENVFNTPSWLVPPDILGRIGPQTGGSNLANRQAGATASLLDDRRLDRLALSEVMDPTNAYSLTTYLTELRRAVWGASATDASVTLDANRRVMQRAYLESLEELVHPPEQQGGGGFSGGSPPPLVAPPNIPRSDLPALARAELTTIRAQARQTSGASSGMARAHWLDVVARIDAILEPR